MPNSEMPHLVRPPAVDWIKIAPYVCVFLTIVSGILGVGMWRMIDQITETSRTAASNAVAIARIDSDRTSRIATSNGRFDKLEQRTAPLETMLKDIGRLETAAGNLDNRMVQGRDERLIDTAKLMDGFNALKTEVALLRQEQQQLRQAVEAKSRTLPPFLESPTWRGPQDPLILRAVLRRASRHGWSGSRPP